MNDMTQFGPEDLTLHVGRVNPNEDSSVVKVGWCLSPRLAEYLKQEEARDPHVLIVVTDQNETHFQQQHVAPLGPGMTIVGLRRAGINEIHATIIWRVTGEAKPQDIANRYELFTRYHRGLDEHDAYAKRLLAEHTRLDARAREPYGGQDRETYRRLDQIEAAFKKLTKQRERIFEKPERIKIGDNYCINRLGFETVVNVDVPAEMFAKDPHPAMKWLADFASRGRRVDQCEMRKYAIFGVLKLVGLALTSPFWVIWKLIGLLYILWHLFLGSRGIDFKSWWTWSYNDIREIGEDTHHSVWLWKRVGQPSAVYWDEADYETRDTWHQFVNPPVMVSFGLFVWLIWWLITLQQLVAYIILGVIALMVIAIVAVAIMVVRQELAKDSILAKQQLKLVHELEPLVCSTPSASGMVREDLHAVRPTFRLVFLKVKSKVCRPFQQ